MNKSPIECRQPIFNSDGTFKEWHIWGIGIEENGDKSNIGWLVAPNGLSPAENSQQYIGMKDRNGKKIYVGDIVRLFGGETYNRLYEFDKITEVIFDVPQFVFQDTTNPKCQYVYEFLDCTLEVIGNMIETPNLLKQ